MVEHFAQGVGPANRRFSTITPSVFRPGCRQQEPGWKVLLLVSYAPLDLSRYLPPANELELTVLENCGTKGPPPRNDSGVSCTPSCTALSARWAST
jgi:hypothetical protein